MADNSTAKDSNEAFCCLKVSIARPFRLSSRICADAPQSSDGAGVPHHNRFRRGTPPAQAPDARAAGTAHAVHRRQSQHPSPLPPPPPLCDIPCGCCSFTGPWTVTRSSLRMLRRVAAFCRPLRPVLLLVSFPRSRRPIVGVLGAVLVVAGVV